ncbi:uncharacterized methyltransferase At2g41040, chloroplastic-like [Triticum aestivum]|uniref:uncharacterized methyltransferase At2g41040, chloroplastic-like n=1 Tax=Triticum aestivum TaxID=4565 RepID=UPI001D025677|nr:uncharacterized methyltransferase At2g41040, chloroplastic-like [Triticum aestivum]
MTTNLAEVYNFVLRGNRALPLTAIVEAIFHGTLRYFRERHELARKHIADNQNTTYCSRVMEYMAKKIEKAKKHNVRLIGNQERRYEVQVPTDGFGSANEVKTPEIELDAISFVSPYYLKEAVLNTWTGEMTGFRVVGNFNKDEILSRPEQRWCFHIDECFHIDDCDNMNVSSYALLNGNIDRKHRGTLMEAGKNLNVLVTRTPRSNWMIHHSWVDRLSWAGLLPLARLAEGTLDEWVDGPNLDEAGGNQSQPFMHSVQSPMLSGGASYFEGDEEDDDQAANAYDFSHTVFHTPPPQPTQETQTMTDEFEEIKTELNDASNTEVFACPVCYEPLITTGPPGMNLPAIYRSGFKCSKCNKSFTSKDVFLDLTVTSGMKEYSELKPARTELFRSPLVSFLYERGWRQNFNRSGFPGRDEEFQMSQDYFQSVAGGILVDVSCGSGLFSRKFASSGAYSTVIALDFSENMLRQCYDYIKQEETPMNTNLALVRADISRLPFASCSIDAIHAGAAIHCWPSPSNAIAEISRVLKAGGVFVATTFLSTPTNSGPFSIDALRPLRQIVGTVNSSYNFFTEGELEDLCTSCGLINYSSKVQRSFIMFSGQKP